MDVEGEGGEGERVGERGYGGGEPGWWWRDRVEHLGCWVVDCADKGAVIPVSLSLEGNEACLMW